MLSNLPKFAQFTRQQNKDSNPSLTNLKIQLFLPQKATSSSSFHFKTHLTAHNLLFLIFETDKKYTLPHPQKKPNKKPK